MKYLRHLLSAETEYSIHSPFIYDYYLSCVKASRTGFGNADVEKIRNTLKKDQTSLSFLNPANGQLLTKSVVSIVKGSAKSPRLCRLLAATIGHFKPKTIIELGTSMGISGLYLWQELSKDGTLWTLEGNTDLFPFANDNFKTLGADNIKLVEGRFKDTLPDTLSKIEQLDLAFIDGHHQYEATLEYYAMLQSKATENTVLIFDDINWSAGMQRAWSEIISKAEVTVSVDLFFVGIVFFRKYLSKETFKLRL